MKAITVLSDEFDKAYVRLIDLADSDDLDGWIKSHGVHIELYIYTHAKDEPWQEIADTGISLYKESLARGQRLFRTEGDSDTVLFFIADSEEHIRRSFFEVENEDLLLHQTLAS